jgi:hypothetical protein
VDVLDMGPHEYGVTITEGTETTYHRVIVPERLIDDLGLVEVDERDLVRESMDYLLDRVPVDSVAHEVDLAELADEHTDYSEEILARLSG